MKEQQRKRTGTVGVILACALLVGGYCAQAAAGDNAKADAQQISVEKNQGLKIEKQAEKTMESSNRIEKRESASFPNGFGKTQTKESDWNLLLVNPQHELPKGFSVNLTKLSHGHAVDQRVYPDLQAMLNAARAEGLSPIICSSYRTEEKQRLLYQNLVDQYQARGYSLKQAKQEAGRWVAAPGTSEHQTGLALDIVSSKYQNLDEKQEQTPEQQWLMNHCHEYGFILRYPSDKKDITGINYEPWHYRYVGKKAAKEINRQGICLEEYLQESDLP